MCVSKDEFIEKKIVRLSPSSLVLLIHLTELLLMQYLELCVGTVPTVDSVDHVVGTSTHNRHAVHLSPQHKVLSGLALRRETVDLPSAGRNIQS